MLALAPEQRIALVIGNSARANRPLRIPVNDAKLMASAVRELGQICLIMHSRGAQLVESVGWPE